MKKIIFILLFVLSLQPLSIKAFEPNDVPHYLLLQPEFVNTQEKVSSFTEYAGLVFTALLSISVVLTILFIVIGGLEYIMSGTPAGKEGGKKRIFSAIQGLILALLSYFILLQINPKLVEWNNLDISNQEVNR